MQCLNSDSYLFAVCGLQSLGRVKLDIKVLVVVSHLLQNLRAVHLVTISEPFVQAHYSLCVVEPDVGYWVTSQLLQAGSVDSLVQKLVRDSACNQIDGKDGVNSLPKIGRSSLFLDTLSEDGLEPLLVEEITFSQVNQAMHRLQSDLVHAVRLVATDNRQHFLLELGLRDEL